MGKKRVMVIDDSRVMELQIQKLLEGSEFEVAAYCENGEEAIARYGEVLPDVTTMDIIMPGIDGLETAQIILEEHPEAKIVMLTSMTDEDSMNEAVSLGAKAFLSKPITGEDLIGTLEKAMK